MAQISIHDLTRRSTLPIPMQSIHMEFQFTTSQGGRHDIIAFFHFDIHFNSRPHKEVDGYAAPFIVHAIFISIHDLTRRSTDLESRNHPSIIFQFTTSQGGRPTVFLTLMNAGSISIHDLTRRSTTLVSPSHNPEKFQFTTSQGGRHIFGCISCFHQEYFNSRPHKEVDEGRQEYIDSLNISIHDLTRRSTPLSDMMQN